jgi:hypothetical protein
MAMNNKNATIMTDEISRRLKSDAWNFQIATGVLVKKRKSTARYLIFSSSALAAVAAVIIAVFLFAVKTDTRTGGYEQFITAQIEGTRNDIAAGTKTTSEKKKEIQEVILENDTDALIEETLAMR